MFTGIITDLGTVTACEQRGDLRARIATGYDVGTIATGASIACDGVCLTVVDKGTEDGRGWFAVDVSAETVSKTTLADWAPGRRLNLERALKVGDELGGHIVSGHVDGVGMVLETRLDGDSTRMTIEVPQALAPYIAPKGSVAVDGTSLTVNEVAGNRFGVNLIPHTKSHTTWGEVGAGRRVNIEIDVLARYVARLRAVAG
jgi:riboflavin synthase